MDHMYKGREYRIYYDLYFGLHEMPKQRTSGLDALSMYIDLYERKVGIKDKTPPYFKTPNV